MLRFGALNKSEPNPLIRRRDPRRSKGLQVGAEPGGVGRARAEAELERRQRANGRDHQARRLISSTVAGRRRRGCRPLRPTARRESAVARATLVEAHDQGCNRRACKQNCPHRLGDHDQRRELPRAYGPGSLIWRESAKRAWEGRKGTNASSRSNPEDEKTQSRQSASKRVLMVGTRLRGRHYGQRS